MKKEEKAVQPAEEKKTALELATEKAAQLTEEYKAKGVFKVNPIVFKDEDSGEDIIGFFKEPSRMAKMAVMDKAVMGAYSAAEEVVDSVLIKEHSDPRMYSESQEFDAIRMGVVMAIYNSIKFKPNLLKKK